MRRRFRFFIAVTVALLGCKPSSLVAEEGDAGSRGEAAPVRRIHFGSCIKQDQPMPILARIVADRPELFLFIGDNIYADTDDMEVMRTKYARLAANPGFAVLRTVCPIMATWDDHDYGRNDAGAEYAAKREAQRIFANFWGDPPDSPRRRRDGVYESRILGPEGKRVQVILLDTRFFRSALKTGERRVGGPYYPDPDPGKTMLGEAQWRWLERQLRKPAELRLIASSIQFVAEAAGQETWSNLPLERTRMIELIASTGASGVIFLSGDRHWADLSMQSGDGIAYPLYDLTSSSLNQLHKRGTPTDNKYRVEGITTYHLENYGMVAIDWEQDDPRVTLEVIDADGVKKIGKTLSLSELRNEKND